MNPQAQQQFQQISQKIEARKAILIAEMTEDFMKEEKEVIAFSSFMKSSVISAINKAFLASIF